MIAEGNSPLTKPGSAQLTVELVFNQSTVTEAFATSPMKLLTPRARGQSIWAYTSSFGGGLVAGDQTRVEIKLGPETRCFLGTQASTKIYRNPSDLPCGHHTHAHIDGGSMLIFAPDPVQAFAEASYTQEQEFDLAPDASLALVDWMSSGRVARGERWVFDHFSSRNVIHVGDETVFLDALELDPADGDLAASHRTGRFNCLGMLLLIGPAMRSAAQQLLATIGARPVERQGELVCSASPVRDGAVLRFAGESVEAVGRELHHHLAPVAELLGDDPWARKW
jgi:urease accessory protein